MNEVDQFGRHAYDDKVICSIKICVWKFSTVNDVTSICAAAVNRSLVIQICEDAVLLSVMSCNLLDMCQRFSVMFCLHLHDKNVKFQKVFLQKKHKFIYIRSLAFKTLKARNGELMVFCLRPIRAYLLSYSVV